jgi:hypothetical protein
MVPWRKVRKVHEAADLFPLMSDAERAELAADIKAHGIRTPIAIFDGLVLDGRNRLDAAEDAGIEVADKEGALLVPHQTLPDNTDPYKFVISANIRRRHLSAEDRQRFLIELISRSPEKGDRKLADEVGVDHKVIGRARRKGNQLGRVPQLNRTIGKDGKARKLPITRKTTNTKSMVKPEASPLMIEAAPPSAQAEPVTSPELAGPVSSLVTSAPTITPAGTAHIDPEHSSAETKAAFAASEFEHIEIDAITKLNGEPGKFSSELTRTLHQMLFQANDDAAVRQAVQQIIRFLETRGLEPANVAVHIAHPTKH